MQRNFIFAGGDSKRFHTVPTIKEQNIAAHSFGVAWLCEILTNGRASKNLIMAALSHDLAEHVVGDIPSPSKREMNIGAKFHEHEMTKLRNAGLGYADQLKEGEALTLKLADMIEGMLFCLKERQMGNHNVDIVYNRFFKYALEVTVEAEKNEAAASFTFDPAVVKYLFHDINTEWKEIANVKSQ